MVDLKAIADRYASELLDQEEAGRLWPRTLGSLNVAISNAARCMTPDGRRHSHQRRIPRVVLQEAERRLLAAEKAMVMAGDFEALYAIVANELAEVRGIGLLATYDIAAGIAAYLGWAPGRVYLHAGAAAGARALGIKPQDGRSVPLEAFPAELRGLPPYHLENLLCIFKAELAGKPLGPAHEIVCGAAIGSGCVPIARHKGMRPGGC